MYWSHLSCSETFDVLVLWLLVSVYVFSITACVLCFSFGIFFRCSASTTCRISFFDLVNLGMSLTFTAIFSFTHPHYRHVLLHTFLNNSYLQTHLCVLFAYMIYIACVVFCNPCLYETQQQYSYLTDSLSLDDHIMSRSSCLFSSSDPRSTLINIKNLQ